MAESYGVVSSGTKEEGEHDRKCDQNRNFLQVKDLQEKRSYGWTARSEATMTAE